MTKGHLNLHRKSAPFHEQENLMHLMSAKKENLIFMSAKKVHLMHFPRFVSERLIDLVKDMEPMS